MLITLICYLITMFENFKYLKMQVLKQSKVKDSLTLSCTPLNTELKFLNARRLLE